MRLTALTFLAILAGCASAEEELARRQLWIEAMEDSSRSAAAPLVAAMARADSARGRPPQTSTEIIGAGLDQHRVGLDSLTWFSYSTSVRTPRAPGGRTDSILVTAHRDDRGGWSFGTSGRYRDNYVQCIRQAGELRFSCSRL